jgi:hypothetical protein
MLFAVFAESRRLCSIRYPSSVTKEHHSKHEEADAPKKLSRLSRPTGEGCSLFSVADHKALRGAWNVAEIKGKCMHAGRQSWCYKAACIVILPAVRKAYVVSAIQIYCSAYQASTNSAGAYCHLINSKLLARLSRPS